jgi:hypothetical protein
MTGGCALHVRAQHEQVAKVSGQPFQLRAVTMSCGCADQNIILPAVPLEQNVQTGQKNRQVVLAMAPGKAFDLLRKLSGEGAAFRFGSIALNRGPWLIGRQVNQWRGSGQLLSPKT